MCRLGPRNRCPGLRSRAARCRYWGATKTRLAGTSNFRFPFSSLLYMNLLTKHFWPIFRMDRCMVLRFFPHQPPIFTLVCHHAGRPILGTPRRLAVCDGSSSGRNGAARRNLPLVITVCRKVLLISALSRSIGSCVLRGCIAQFELKWCALAASCWTRPIDLNSESAVPVQGRFLHSEFRFCFLSIIHAINGFYSKLLYLN